jgi:class 3 adenylate cyclase
VTVCTCACVCDVSARLWDLGLLASVGITTGVVFCGVVGSATRKEYTVLGDTVNLSARLMQYAFINGGGVVCDQQVCRR